MTTEYIDGFDPTRYKPFINMISESIQHGAFLSLYSLSTKRKSLERVIGRRHLSDEELETIKFVMHECLNSAISGLLNNLDNHQDYIESLDIVSDGKTLNKEDRLQAIFHSEELGVAREFIEKLNKNNYIDLLSCG